MIPDKATIGKQVQIYNHGSILTIKDVAMRYARLVKVNDDGSEEDFGDCPLSLLEEVEQ